MTTLLGHQWWSCTRKIRWQSEMLGRNFATLLTWRSGHPNITHYPCRYCIDPAGRVGWHVGHLGNAHRKAPT